MDNTEEKEIEVTTEIKCGQDIRCLVFHDITVDRETNIIVLLFNSFQGPLAVILRKES